MASDATDDVRTSATPEQLKRIAGRVPDLVGSMIGDGRSTRSIGHAVSDIADAVTVRLLEMAEERFGPPPVPYAWLAAGSQGRRELTAGSDQDNGMILDDRYREADHEAYFGDFSTFVCDGLNTCGYVYCPGEMMAAVGRWRQPLQVWRTYFARWIEEPEPKALMLASVFFDFRCIGGASPLFEELHRGILDKTKRNTIFLAYLARNAMSRRPPIGLFRRFLLTRGGEHDRTLDLKLNGVTPIVELARLQALSTGIGEVNTFARLEALGSSGVMSRSGAADLAAALELIGFLRLRHQVKMAREGRRVDNHVPPEEFSEAEKTRLKAAFATVKTMQSAIATSFRFSDF